MTATVEYAGNDFFIGVSPSGHAHVFDTNGDRQSAPTPVEMLLSAVGACTGSDVISILAKKRQVVTAYRVEVTGDRREDFPRSFRTIHIHHIVRGHGLSQDAIAAAIELSDKKYCSVAATLRPAAEIHTSFEIIDDAAHAAAPDA